MKTWGQTSHNEDGKHPSIHLLIQQILMGVHFMCGLHWLLEMHLGEQEHISALDSSKQMCPEPFPQFGKG